MTRATISQIISFFCFLLAQVFIATDITLFNIAFCFIYVNFLITLPFDTGRMTLLFLGLCTGLIVDIFSDTLGIHSAACVLIMYLRPHWVGVLTPQGGYDNGISEISWHKMGSKWFISYIFVLILIHHATIFFIEASNFSLFFLTLLKIICSSFYTLAWVMLIQYLFFSPRNKI